MALSPTAHVVLGMLRLGKRNGYEIKQLSDQSTRFFWNASFGQIYPELRKLEEAGLVRGLDDPQGGRQRRAYELTAEGADVLDEWLRSPGPLTNEMRDEALLRMFFADSLAPAERAAIAREARLRHEQVVAALEQVEKDVDHDEDSSCPLVVLQFGLDYHRWCAERFGRMERDLLPAKE